MIPSGAHLVRVRAIDIYDQVQLVPRDVDVTVSAPAGNVAPSWGRSASATRQITVAAP